MGGEWEGSRESGFAWCFFGVSVREGVELDALHEDDFVTGKSPLGRIIYVRMCLILVTDILRLHHALYHRPKDICPTNSIAMQSSKQAISSPDLGPHPH